jgi:hypothetical protein
MRVATLALVRVAAFLMALLAACDGGTPPGGTPDAGPPAPPDAGPVAQGDEARGDVVINEVASKPAAGPDWIELYSRAAAPVDLSGWYLSDAPDRLDHYYQFPAGTILAPGAYLLVVADDGVTGAPFSLAREDGAYLLDPDGIAADSLLYLGASDGRSLARVPDGEGRFYFAAETPGAANGSAP